MEDKMLLQKLSRAISIFVISFIAAQSLFLFNLQSQPTLLFNRVSVNWPQVMLAVQVKCGTDQRSDLTNQNFKVVENGTEITDFTVVCPQRGHCCVSVSLVIDRSGKMGTGLPPFIEGEKAAGKAFVDAMDPDNSGCDEATVISFNQTVTVDVFMTIDKAMLKRGIDALQASGSSAVWDAGVIGIQELANNGTQECRGVVFVTDGEKTSSTNTVDDVISIALANRVRIFTIGFGSVINDTDLQRIATVTGGRYYKVPDASQLVQISKEIYFLLKYGFYECEIEYTAKCMDGTRRNVDLTLQRLFGCPGPDTKTKSYKAPKDTSTYAPISIRLDSAVVSPGDLVSIPLLLETPINELFNETEFKILFDITCCQLLKMDVKGYLLDGVPCIIDTVTGGYLIKTQNEKIINGSGVLAMLIFKASNSNTETICPLKLSGWTFKAGCLAPRLSDGEIIISTAITLNNPNGREIFCPGDTTSISWTSQNIQTVDIAISNDSGLTFTPLTQGIAGNNYQWRIPTNIPSGTGYIIRVKENGGIHYDVSKEPFTIGAAPTIINQPMDQQVCVGDSVFFSVAANNAENYQWYRNGSLAIAETLSTMKLKNVEEVDSGKFFVIVSNLCGQNYSRTATLTVNKPPIILQHPIDQIVPENSRTTFSVTASGTKLSYQWMKDGVVIPGAKGSSFTVVSVRKKNEGYYSVKVSDSCGFIISNPARLSIEITDVQSPARTLSTPILYQSYPNPYSKSFSKQFAAANHITIAFGIPSQSIIQINIYDALGREVTTLVNQEYSSGLHTIIFDASNYPPGIYSYQLRSGVFSISKRMIIVN